MLIVAWAEHYLIVEIARPNQCPTGTQATSSKHELCYLGRIELFIEDVVEIGLQHSVTSKIKVFSFIGSGIRGWALKECTVTSRNYYFCPRVVCRISQYSTSNIQLIHPIAAHFIENGHAIIQWRWEWVASAEERGGSGHEIHNNSRGWGCDIGGIDEALCSIDA